MQQQENDSRNKNNRNENKSRNNDTNKHTNGPICSLLTLRCEEHLIKGYKVVWVCVEMT